MVDPKFGWRVIARRAITTTDDLESTIERADPTYDLG